MKNRALAIALLTLLASPSLAVAGSEKIGVFGDKAQHIETPVEFLIPH